jgi:hypothetical protein
MSQFILTLDLADHKHPENQRAQHQTVHALLDQASQAIGSSNAREGEFVYPPGSNKVIGSWKFLDDLALIAVVSRLQGGKT